jgi:hypothetical protein
MENKDMKFAISMQFWTKIMTYTFVLVLLTWKDPDLIDALIHFIMSK